MQQKSKVFVSEHFGLQVQMSGCNIYQFETAQTDFIETFESKTQALARQCFHFQDTSFLPTQQRPSRALTESSADQFYLILQLNFQKLVLVFQFLFTLFLSKPKNPNL
ncbi:Hypothetical_protein [Hexamita inflata]|uniref:Hypothetical_protein n=1 Tax=Hexamita inflata TaxID=28002 RepID=A0ABP1I7M1_9EUKA